MSWWKTALHDTCSIITLDKLLLERASLARHFPSSIAALEQSFTADQLREDTGQRMRQRVTICSLPSPAELNGILSSASLPKALSEVDKLVYAVAVHHKLSVVTADKRLAKALHANGLRVGNMAIVLRELVVAKKLTTKGCERLLVALVVRKEFLLGTPTPTWADLRDHSFPDQDRAECEMAKQPKGELVPVVVGFNYDLLEAKVAEKVRSSADRIRERVKKTVEDIIEVGNDPLAVKEALEHGQFGPWLKAEFGWSERTAQNFMSVAERFKSTRIADLPIQPTAAYLLAAPAVPDQAREVAIEKAKAGEQITTAVAKEIVAEVRKKGRRKERRVPADKLAGRLVKALERWRERWGQKEVSELARHQREFADQLEEAQRAGKKKTKGD